MGNRDVASTGDASRVGIWELAPGIQRSNFYSLLGAAFFSIGLLNLVGNLRPYLFNSMLSIPDDIQGRLSAGMDVVSEIPALLLSGLVGAASDKLGRRAIYAMGFLILWRSATCCSRFVGADWTLYGMVFITACGASLVSAMLSTVIADYPRETSRGKLVGICFFLNGLGVASLVGIASKLPQFYLERGFDALRRRPVVVLDRRRHLPRANGDRGARPRTRLAGATFGTGAAARHAAGRHRGRRRT